MRLRRIITKFPLPPRLHGEARAFLFRLCSLHGAIGHKMDRTGTILTLIYPEDRL